ncbi:hypothetical protein [Pseudoflavonifractor phocaeensis]|uniref:hypothetical protein n=1 Tax=Pseudoflavonifractor phocaeensis TaxID=1870988 RepID=UPI00195855E7|nr:hypothetical protein [Pseudoflavonifractor phocaeensis]MBM6722761.1 hypothetical protein [Pseudoflavonifractor phocaeensis]
MKDFKIRGENDQDLTRFLLINEARMTKEAFHDLLCKSMAYDKRNFSVGKAVEIVTNGEEKVAYPVILGEHAKKRIRQRTSLSEDKVFEIAQAYLRDPMIGPMVAGNKVRWDKEANKTIPVNGRWVATVVKLYGEDLVLVFETGEFYIRLKTIMKRPADFHTPKDNFQITVTRGGQILCGQP